MTAHTSYTSQLYAYRELITVNWCNLRLRGVVDSTQVGVVDSTQVERKHLLEKEKDSMRALSR